MKKLLLLAASVLCISAAQAQTADGPSVLSATSLANEREPGAYKAAYASDTGLFTLSTFVPSGYTNGYLRQIFDTSIASRIDAATPYDSGYYFGINRTLNRGYAEQFHFAYKPDTALRILGVRSIWSGRVQANSTKQVTITVWKKGGQTTYGTKVYHSGLPTTIIKSMNVNANNLGTNAAAGLDSFKSFWFPTRFTMAAIDSYFYVGYTMPAYTYGALANDTFGLRSSRANYAYGTGSYLRGSAPEDTILYNQNVYLSNAGTWGDIYTDLGRNRNLSIVPIVQLQGSKFTGVEGGLTQKGLTFMGAFPNPATNVSTVRVSLKNATDVTLELSDVNGRSLSSKKLAKLAAGQHDLQVSVSELPAGNYVIMIQTGEGDAIASMITVTK